MYKKIKFVITSCFMFFIKKVFSIIPRDKKLCIFNCMTNSHPKTYGFTHNTKYLFLYMSEHKECGLTPIWITPDKTIVKELKENGFNACYRHSLKGIFYCLRAKYFLINIDINTGELPMLLSAGAVIINFWHAITYKHIGYDNPHLYNSLKEWQKKFFRFVYYRNDYMISNSDYDKKIYGTAYFMPENSVITLGSPRLDTLYYEINGENLFMENDIKNLLSLKEKGKKLILYVPTYRDTGKDIGGWVNNADLKEILKSNNATLVCKLHPADANSMNTDNSDEFYKMHKNSDVNAILKYTDALITDYSSVAFDYLLLDRPIIYYPLDLEEYQATCHGFYMEYEKFAVGEICKSEKEIINAIQNAIIGIDNYKEQRSFLRQELFTYKDGHNCARIVKWIKSIDKKGK